MITAIPRPDVLAVGAIEGHPQKALWRGGMHRNELIPEEIAEYLRALGLAEVDAVISDTVAEPGVREPNINDFFPGSPNAPHPKARRAWEITQENKGYRMVVDGHNTLPGGSDHAWVNTETLDPELRELTLGFLALTEFDVIVDWRYANNMLRYSPNGVLVDLAPEGPKTDPAFWVDPLVRLARGDVPPAKVEDFTWFRFVGNVTHKQRIDHNLPDQVERYTLVPGAEGLATELGHPGRELYALCWGDPSPIYCGEVVFKIDPSEAFAK